MLGHDSGQMTVSERARQVGFLFQNPDHQLFADSVWEEATFAARNFGTLDSTAEARVGELLDRCGLGDRRDDHPYRLSYGEKRRLNLISVLSYRPKLILLDEVLIGHKVELVFDPFDLTDIEVRYRGRSHGKAIAFTLGRHVHPKARPEHPATQPEPSGIDYLKLIDAAHTQQLESRINYTALFGDTDDGIDDGTEPAEAAP